MLIPIETKVREAEAKLLLAFHAVIRGFEVVIGNQQVFWDHADLMGRGLYIDKSIAATREQWFQRCKTLGNDIAAWDEEGLVYFNPEMYRKLRVSPSALEQTVVFFAWGNAQKNAISEAFPKWKDKIVPCGNPRFDLLRSDYRAFLLPDAQRIQKRHGRILLINTNFAFYNHYRKPSEVRAMLSAYPLAAVPGYIDGWIETQRKAFDGFSETLSFLSRRFPDHTVLIRPHPSENHDAWRKISAGIPRTKVDASGNVHEWILASDLLIHFNCTTAIEAYLLEVTPIAYRPVIAPEYENPLPNALSIHAFNKEELAETVKMALKHRDVKPFWLHTSEKKEILHQHVSGITEKSSTQAILDVMETLGFPAPLKRDIKRGVNVFAKKYWRAVLRHIRSFQQKDDGYSLQKFDGLSKQEITEIHKRACKIWPEMAGVRINRVMKDCWHLKKG
ncbi:MAG: surface carbohydrate biosynthesis protein [Promethearchaeota archaeon]